PERPAPVADPAPHRERLALGGGDYLKIADRRRQGAEDRGEHPLAALLEISRRWRSVAQFLQFRELRAGKRRDIIVGAAEPEGHEIFHRVSEHALGVADPLVMIAVAQ